MVSSLVAGIAAGLAVAVPIGAIGILIIEAGLRRGFRAAAAAGAGAATVDGLYATTAAVFGGAVAALVEPILFPLRVVSAIVLIVIGVKLLRDGLVAVRAHAADPTGVAVMSGEDAPRSEWRTYLTFVGLTAVNPVTVIYFAALVIGLPDRPSTLGEQLAFAFGAFAASFAWQLTIAGASAVAHRRLPPSFRAWTTVLGAVVVLVFAGIVAVDVVGSVAGSS